MITNVQANSANALAIMLNSLMLALHDTISEIAVRVGKVTRTFRRAKDGTYFERT